jgi:hypothetical protein
LAELKGTNKLSSLTDVTISVPCQKHFESCMKLFISDQYVFCDLIHYKLVEKPFKNEVGKSNILYDLNTRIQW